MTLKRDIRKLLNPITGLEEGEIPVLTHQSLPLRDEWMFDHVKGDLRLAKEGLSGRDYDVLMVYKAWLKFSAIHSNYAQVTQQEIADYLG